MSSLASKEDVVPETFAELFDNYWTYSVQVMIKRGVHPDNAEDVAMTILTRLYERDIIAMYQPGQRQGGGITHTGKHDTGRVTKFKTFLTAFLNAYVRHHVEKQAKESQREQPGLVAKDSGGTWEQVTDVETLMFDTGRLTVSLLRQTLDYSQQLLIQAIEELGEANSSKLARRFKVPVTQMDTELEKLRELAEWASFRVA